MTTATRPAVLEQWAVLALDERQARRMSEDHHGADRRLHGVEGDPLESLRVRETAGNVFEVTVAPPLDTAALWTRVEKLQRDVPYCHMSRRGAHQDAARQVALEEKLRGEDLATWNSFVYDRTKNYSNRTGD